MKKHKNLYQKLCLNKNLVLSYRQAKKGKAKKSSVVEFDLNTENNILKLQKELVNFSYEPKPLKRFIVRDPKTRTIHASAFVDRIVHHAIVDSLEPIYERVFIYDSFASRKNKGAHLALQRFDKFKRKVSRNGLLVGGGAKQEIKKTRILFKVMSSKQIFITILIMLITKF